MPVTSAQDCQNLSMMAEADSVPYPTNVNALDVPLELGQGALAQRARLAERTHARLRQAWPRQCVDFNARGLDRLLGFNASRRFPVRWARSSPLFPDDSPFSDMALYPRSSFHSWVPPGHRHQPCVPSRCVAPGVDSAAGPRPAKWGQRWRRPPGPPAPSRSSCAATAGQQRAGLVGGNVPGRETGDRQRPTWSQEMRRD
eukprot:EG_transcript_18803